MNKKIVIGSIIVFIIDLISKILINNFLSLDSVIKIIPGFFSIEKVYNTGVSFGMFKDNQIIVIIFTIIIFAFLLYMHRTFKKNIRNIIAFSMLFGGIIGNLCDRVLYGQVIDFLSFKFGSYNFPVFNIADIGICVGMAFVVLAIILKEDKEENK